MTVTRPSFRTFSSRALSMQSLGRLTVLGLAVTHLAGCQILLQGLQGKTATTSAAEYEGDECNEVRQTREQSDQAHGSGSRSVASTPRERVLVAVCPEQKINTYRSGQAVLGTLYQTRVLPQTKHVHKEFSFRKPRMLDVTTMLIASFAEHDEALPGRENTATSADAAAGMAAVYASLLDPAALDKELAETKLPPSVVAEYKKAVEQHKQKAEQHLAKMPPAVRQVVYEIPQQISEDLRKEYSARKALGDRLDVLAARADEARAGKAEWAKTAAELTQLRSDVLSACGGTEECTYHPLYAEATHELATLYVVAKQVGPARAESHLLTRKGSMRRMFQPAVYAAQYQAGRQSSATLEQSRNNAKLDPKLAKAAKGEGANFSFAQFYEASPSLPFLAASLGDERGASVGGYVESVGTKGDKSLVTFRTEYQDVPVATSCVKTNRIERIDRDGRIQYEEKLPVSQ